MGNASPDGSAAGNGWVVVQPSPFDRSFACAIAAPSSAENWLCVPTRGRTATSTSARATACAHNGAAPRRARRERVSSGAMSASVAQLAAQLVDLIAQPGGVLEPQVRGRLVHLLFERLDQPAELGGSEIAELVAPALVAG